jgi:hypothetical protein
MAGMERTPGYRMFRRNGHRFADKNMLQQRQHLSELPGRQVATPAWRGPTVPPDLQAAKGSERRGWR